MPHSTGDRFGPYETLASIDASHRQQSEQEANKASARVVPSWLQPVPVRQCRAALSEHIQVSFRQACMTSPGGTDTVILALED